MKTPTKKIQKKNSSNIINKSTPKYKIQKTPKKIIKTPKIQKYKSKNGPRNSITKSKCSVPSTGKTNKLGQLKINDFLKKIENPEIGSPGVDPHIATFGDGSGTSVGIKLKVPGAKFQTTNKEDLHFGAKLTLDVSTVKTELADSKQPLTINRRCDQESKYLVYR